MRASPATACASTSCPPSRSRRAGGLTSPAHLFPRDHLEPDPSNCPGCVRHSGRGSFFQAVGLPQVPDPGALQRVTGLFVSRPLSLQQAAARTFESSFVPDPSPQNLHLSPSSLSIAARPNAAEASAT